MRHLSNDNVFLSPIRPANLSHHPTSTIAPPKYSPSYTSASAGVDRIEQLKKYLTVIEESGENGQVDQDVVKV
jgi:hypothetical protein